MKLADDIIVRFSDDIEWRLRFLDANDWWSTYYNDSQDSNDLRETLLRNGYYY